MKLSVIVPVYNSEKYLKRCLTSLVNQTVCDFEIIVVNDGSNDSSLTIINDFVASYPSLIRLINVENGGQGRARNFGLDLSNSDYIGFCDSDDYVSFDMYSKLIDKCESDSADIAICDYYRVVNGSKAIEPASYHDNIFSFAGAVWNKVFKANIINDIRFPEGLWYEDLAFSSKAILNASKISYLKEPLYFYDVSNMSTMRNNNASKNLDILDVMDDIKAYFKEVHLDEFQFLLINNVLLDTVNRLATQTSSNKDAVIKKIISYVHGEIPNLTNNDCFKRESIKRKIIMYINFLGGYKISAFLLRKKSAQTSEF